jgi:hypothetical protein
MISIIHILNEKCHVPLHSLIYIYIRQYSCVQRIGIKLKRCFFAKIIYLFRCTKVENKNISYSILKSHIFQHQFQF